MNFLRAILASLMSLLCTVAVSAYVTYQTLETTILNKQEVKTWVHDSKAYDTLFPTLVNADQTIDEQTSNARSTLVTKETIQSALNQTFSASYVQAESEKIIDSTYNWLNGTSNAVTFSVNTTSKKDDFIQNLATLIQPQLAKLPQCASYSQFDASNPTCLPPGANAAQTATALATDAADSSPFFKEPITEKTVEEANKQSNTTSTESPVTSAGTTSSRSLPQAIQVMTSWAVWLPLTALVSGGLCIVLSRDHFKATKHLAGRLTVGLGLTAAVGLVVASVGKTFKISSGNAITTNIIEPIVHQAAPAIGYRLALVSGGLAVLTFVLWLTLFIIQKRHQKAELLKPPVDMPSDKPVAPAPKSPSTTPAQPPKTPPSMR